LLLAASDAVLVHLGFYLAFLMRFGLPLPQENVQPYLRLVPISTALLLIVFYFFDLYSGFRRRSLSVLLYSSVLAVLTFTFINIAVIFWDRGFAFPRSVLVIAAALQLVLIVLSRIVVWYVAKRTLGRKKVLIVGETREQAAELARKFVQHERGWFVLQGAIRYDEKDIVRRIQDHDVILLSSTVPRTKKEEILDWCVKNNKEVLVVPDLFDVFVLSARAEQIDDLLVLSIQSPGLTPSQKVAKRLLDVSVSLIMLLLLSPILLVLYILIPLTSKGPAIYSQERLGLQGKPFRVYKFRSMVQDAEKYTGPVLAGEKDPRITPLGRFLRATRLDELPQLINVLKGDMSLVGPRPERPYFVKQFEQTIPGYGYRMVVKPGLTGLAQVMGKYSTTPEDKLRYDLLYIRNYSLLLDLKILFQTARVVLQKEKASGVAENAVSLQFASDSSEKTRIS